MRDGFARWDALRLALANMMALGAYVGVIWFCFAFIAGFAGNSAAPWGFTVRLNDETFGFGLILTIFIGPIALLIMLIYFIAFRAKPRAIAALAAVAAILAVAFMSPWLRLPGWIGGNGGLIAVVWAAATAALAHHVVFALLRPRRVLEKGLARSMQGI